MTYYTVWESCDNDDNTRTLTSIDLAGQGFYSHGSDPEGMKFPTEYSAEAMIKYLHTTKDRYAINLEVRTHEATTS